MLTPTRVRIAYAVAIGVDVFQWVLGPVGWAFADEILDVFAAGLLPTWTGCVALVVMLRRRQEPPPPAPGAVIDI